MAISSSWRRASRAASITAPPTLYVTWLPLEVALNGAVAVSATSTRTLSGATPNASADRIASPVAVPLMSGEPTVTATMPSGSTRQPAAEGVRAPPQEPSATPTASSGPRAAVYRGWRLASSSTSTDATRGQR